MDFLNEFKNKLLTGRERNPQRKNALRRVDVHPDVHATIWVETAKWDGIPEAGESHRRDALLHPEKYNWIAQGSSSFVSITGIDLTFTSDPFSKEGHWHASAMDSDGNQSEYTLYALGIVPDFIFNPQQIDGNPAGWNPSCYCSFNKSNGRST